jgi:hypothetical protein
MKKKLLIIFLALYPIFTNAQNNKGYKELEFKSIHQLYNYTQRFDLSGIVKVNSKIFVIADKETDSLIYEVIFEDKIWNIKNFKPFSIKEELDIEGIDYCNGSYFLINEKNSGVYQLNESGETKEIFINYSGFGEMPSNWVQNAGLEGIAIDCVNQILYLIKERDERYIYKVNIETGAILEKFDIPQVDSQDFSDAKYENGFLYLLERNGNFIAKVDIKSNKVVSKVTFKSTCSAPEGKLYEPAKFGMAEALLLTKDEIWIGLDNNGLTVSPFAQKKYGINGKNPVIIKFKRPKGF